MRKARRFLLAIVACTLAAGPSSLSCHADKAAGPQGVSVGYSAPELSGGQGRILNSFLEQAARKGWKVLTANASSDAQVQESQIQYLLSRGVRAIVAVPVDSTAICASVERARAAGVPFFTIDRAPIGCQIAMSCLSDNRMAGAQSGTALVDILTRRYGTARGTVLELQGNLAQNVAQLRGAGFHDVVSRHPRIRVISRETRWESERFASETAAVLASENVDAIYLHSDAIGIPAVLPVLERMGRKLQREAPGHVALVGVDGSPEALKAIRAGFADQASSQPVPDFGIIVEWMEKVFTGDEVRPGAVSREGALWSPAMVQATPAGYQLILSTTSVTARNVDEPRLWGNQ
jgi:ABC-type sugar transport system substrate-binding protein